MVQRRGRSKGDREMYETLREGYALIYPSAEDIAGCGTRSAQKIHAQLQKAEEEGLVHFIWAGQTFEIQRRAIYTSKGVHLVRTEFDLPLKPHHLEQNQEENLQRIRLYEVVNRLAPRFWRSGAVQTPVSLALDPGDDPRELVLDESVTLQDIHWLQATRNVPLHGIWEYRTSHGEKVHLPVVTVGLHHVARRRESQGPQSLSDFWAEIETVPGFPYRQSRATPIGVLFLAIDRLAGLYVQRRFRGIPKAIVDAQGCIIEQLVPVPPVGRIVPVKERHDPVGEPERRAKELMSDPVFASSQGVPRRRVIEFVHSHPNSPVDAIANGVGQPPSAVKNQTVKRGSESDEQKRKKGILDDFMDAGLIEILDGGVLLSREGRESAALRDRLSAQVLHASQGIYTGEDSTYRLQQREHDRDVAHLFGQLKRMGILVFGGWRLEISCRGRAKIRPDLWALVPIGNGIYMWHVIEVERSALGSAAAETRLGNHRRCRDLGEEWPSLWVVGKGPSNPRRKRADDAAAERYMGLGNDLPLLVIPRYQAFDETLEFLRNGWLRDGQRVPIDHLKHVVIRPELLVRLENRVPSGFGKERKARAR